MKRFVVLAMLALAKAWAEQPTICALNPPVSIEAGASLSARIQNPTGGKCTALLRFADPTHLPLTWYFDPLQCAGAEIAELFVPDEAPNGDAFVTWQCAGDATLTLCNHILIYNGASDPIPSAKAEYRGVVRCASGPYARTTTLATRAKSSAVLVRSNAISQNLTNIPPQYLNNTGNPTNPPRVRGTDGRPSWTSQTPSSTSKSVTTSTLSSDSWDDKLEDLKTSVETSFVTVTVSVTSFVESCTNSGI